MAKNKETLAVQNPALLAIGSRDDVLAWRQMVGTFRQPTPPYTPVKVGQVGQSDCAAVVALTITPEIAAKLVGKTIGVAAQFEFKTATGRLSDAQVNWGRAVQQRGGVFRVVRSVAEAEEVIRDIQVGTAW